MQRLSASAVPPAVSATIRSTARRAPRGEPVEVAQDADATRPAPGARRPPARCTPPAGSSARRSRAAGRCQFSWLKAKSVSTPTPACETALDHLPHRRHAGMMAQRPGQRAALGPAAVAVHDDGDVGGDRAVHPEPLQEIVGSSAQTSMISASLAWIRPSICLMWSSVSFWMSFSARVLSSSETFSSFLILREGVGAGVAHRDAALLGQLVHHLDQLLAALLATARAAAPGSGCPAWPG